MCVCVCCVLHSYEIRLYVLCYIQGECNYHFKIRVLSFKLEYTLYECVTFKWVWLLCGIGDSVMEKMGDWVGDVFFFSFSIYR